MSSGNWDYIAWNEEGKKISSFFTCYDGTVIELFKDYIFLKTQGKKIVIFNGELDGNSFFLYAERVKLQDAIFLVVYDPYTDKHFFGIGANAWHDDYIGISDPLKEKFIEWVKSLPEKTVNPIVTENDIPSSFEGF